jgi:transposase
LALFRPGPARDARGVGYNFITSDAADAFLLPQDVRQWLPPGHLCWKVLDVVGAMDLSAFMAGYRSDGQGAAAYHPAVMVALILYCYSKGTRSSREIERACWDDMGCRIITANRRVDHATLARFVRRHRAALDGLFTRVLALCAREGLVDPSVVAIDGSAVTGNASLDSNRSLERLDAVIARCEGAIAALLEETLVCAQRCASEEGYQPPRDRAANSGPARLSRLADRLLRARAARDRIHERALPSPGADAEKLAAAARMVGRAERALGAVLVIQQARLDAYTRRNIEARAAGLPQCRSDRLVG